MGKGFPLSNKLKKNARKLREETFAPVFFLVVAQLVKNLPAMQETWVPSLGLNNPPEESMATHSSILAWRIPWTEEPGGLQSMGSQSRT